MDAGLYNLTADQTALDTHGELIVFNNAKRACSSVALSAGVFTVSPTDPMLWLANFDFTRTTVGSGSGYAYGALATDPVTNRADLGYGIPAFNPAMDGTSGYSGTSGPALGLVHSASALRMGPVFFMNTGGAYTLNKDYSWLAALKMSGPLSSAGLYNLSGAQTLVDTLGEQIVWNNTKRACAGVTLSSGAFQFASGHIYVAMAAFFGIRTSGAGTTLGLQWTTDSTGAGTTAYAVGHPARMTTGDGTSNTGSNAGCIAVIDTTGGAVTLGTNVQAVPATTAFTINTDNSYVSILRLT